MSTTKKQHSFCSVPCHCICHQLFTMLEESNERGDSCSWTNHYNWLEWITRQVKWIEKTWENGHLWGGRNTRVAFSLKYCDELEMKGACLDISSTCTQTEMTHCYHLCRAYQLYQVVVFYPYVILTLTPLAGSDKVTFSNHPEARPSLLDPSLPSCHFLGGSVSTLKAIINFLFSISGELSYTEAYQQR